MTTTQQEYTGSAIERARKRTDKRFICLPVESAIRKPFAIVELEGI